MRSRGMKWGLLALGMMGTGCATVGGTGAPAAASASAAERPTCPVTIADERPLELGYRPQLVAREWVPALAPARLGFAEESHARESFRQRLELASGAVEVSGLEERGDPAKPEGGASVVFALPDSGGYCVVNSWSTWLTAKVGLSLASLWTSADKSLALLLLKLELAPEGQPQTRWVVLGTDGARAWIALGEPPQHQLIVPSVAFFTSGKDVYLDVKQRYVTRMRLGKDGHFLQPASTR